MRFWKLYRKGKYGVEAWRNGLRVWKRLIRPWALVRERLRQAVHVARGHALPAAPGEALNRFARWERTGGQCRPELRGSGRQRLGLRSRVEPKRICELLARVLQRLLTPHKARGIPGQPKLAQTDSPLLPRSSLPALRRVGTEIGPGVDGRVKAGGKQALQSSTLIRAKNAATSVFTQQTAGISGGVWVRRAGARLLILQADEAYKIGNQLHIR